MSNLTPLHKRQVADRFLAWLKEGKLEDWPKTYPVLCQASEELGEEIYGKGRTQLW